MTDTSRDLFLQVERKIDTTKNVLLSTKLAPACMKSLISTALISRIQTVRSVRTISFDEIKLIISDFKDVEIPAVQIIDLNSQVTHEQSRIKWFWRLAVEIILKSTEWDTVSQQDLWNLEYEVIRAIFAYPNLNVPGVIHCHLLGSATDLHLLKPYYFSRLDLQVEFYEAAVRPC
jgi:hypothetical protein